MESIGRTTGTAAGSLWRKQAETHLEQIHIQRKIFPSLSYVTEERLKMERERGTVQNGIVFFSYAMSLGGRLFPIFVFATVNEARRYFSTSVLTPCNESL